MEPNQNNPQTEPAAEQTPLTTIPETNNQAEPQQESKLDLGENNVMAALSYIGPLVLIPFLTKRDDLYVLFHIKQGLVLLVLSLIVYVASGFLFFLFPIFMLINLGLFIIAIIGVINALTHKEKELPLVGKFASHIKI